MINMHHINQEFIDIGLKLRKEYLETSNTVDNNINELDSILNNIEELSTQLDSFSKTLDNIPQEEAKRILNEKLSTLVKESTKVETLCQPLNKKMDALKKEEQNLFIAIKTTHPELSDKEIADEFLERVIKKVEF